MKKRLVHVILFDMLFISIVHHYLLWHYTSAFKEILHVYKNFMWFVVHYFSLPQLLRSYISPWKRMTEDRGQTLSFEDLAGFVIINLISRIIGMILRTMIIVSGTLALVLLTAGLILTYCFWLFAPALLLVFIYYGLVLIFA
jgi:hypothetical protein